MASETAHGPEPNSDSMSAELNAICGAGPAGLCPLCSAAIASHDNSCSNCKLELPARERLFYICLPESLILAGYSVHPKLQAPGRTGPDEALFFLEYPDETTSPKTLTKAGRVLVTNSSSDILTTRHIQTVLLDYPITNEERREIANEWFGHLLSTPLDLSSATTESGPGVDFIIGDGDAPPQPAVQSKLRWLALLLLTCGILLAGGAVFLLLQPPPREIICPGDPSCEPEVVIEVNVSDAIETQLRSLLTLVRSARNTMDEKYNYEQRLRTTCRPDDESEHCRNAQSFTGLNDYEDFRRVTERRIDQLKDTMTTSEEEFLHAISDIARLYENSPPALEEACTRIKENAVSRERVLFLDELRDLVETHHQDQSELQLQALTLWNQWVNVFQ